MNLVMSLRMPVLAAVAIGANAICFGQDPCDVAANRSNCVKYTRARLPNLSNTDLTYFRAKMAAINANSPVAGLAAVIDTGSIYGHLAVVERVYGDGTVKIRESNWGQPIVSSRRGTPVALKIKGYVRPSTPPLFPLYRYMGTNGRHHYTTDVSELGWGNYGFSYEFIQCRLYPYPVGGSAPVYRYWNSRTLDHFFTANWNELGSGRGFWIYEGIEGHAAGSTPLFRYWHPILEQHFYTTNWGELGAGGGGWTYEGIACYVR